MYAQICISLHDDRQVSFDFLHFERWRMELAVGCGYARRVKCPCGTHDYYLPEHMPKFTALESNGVWCRPPADPLDMLFAIVPNGESGEVGYIDSMWCGAVADRIEQTPLGDEKLAEFGQLMAQGLRECHRKGSMWFGIE